ncbi:MAG: acetoin dehydrogenase dihydrolipoyllysine-residue acetyltransferase subunit [Rhodospirillales bacterium]|nr:acetoin dehydrogenase dihydrolipoyllysine-residue acetyltransferase subunit [Rhodospirillales bacterium]
MSDVMPLVMPKWGLSMEEGTLTAWLVAEGDDIAKGQEVAEIETTKIANVLESPRPGHVRRLVAKVGDTLPVGALLAVLAPASVPEVDIDAFVAGFVAAAPAQEGEAAAIAEARFEHAGRPIAYKLAGAGQEGDPAVLVHGFGGDSDNWLFNIEALAAGRPVYAIDLPGHGHSTKQLDRGDIDEMASAVLALLDEAGLGRVHLVGHSLGAAVALETLARAPGRVASFAGLAPAGLAETVNADFINAFVAAEKRRDVKAALQHLFADPNLVSPAMIEGVQKYKRLEGAREALAAIAATSLPAGRQARLYRDLVAEARRPMLVIWGRNDAVLDPAAAEGLPDSVEVLRLDDVGHMPHMEAAAAVNEALARHFSKVGG